MVLFIWHIFVAISTSGIQYIVFKRCW